MSAGDTNRKEWMGADGKQPPGKLAGDGEAAA